MSARSSASRRRIDDAGLPDSPRLRETLKAYFRWSIERMAAYPSSAHDVPANLRLGRWTWDGPA